MMSAQAKWLYGYCFKENEGQDGPEEDGNDPDNVETYFSGYRKVYSEGCSELLKDERLRQEMFHEIFKPRLTELTIDIIVTCDRQLRSGSSDLDVSWDVDCTKILADPDVHDKYPDVCHKTIGSWEYFYVELASVSSETDLEYEYSNNARVAIRNSWAVPNCIRISDPSFSEHEGKIKKQQITQFAKEFGLYHEKDPFFFLYVEPED